MDNFDKPINVREQLMRIYDILMMTPQESKMALNDLAGLQYLAVSSELLADLSSDEVQSLNKIANEEERQNQIKLIVQKHQEDAQFVAKVLAARDKVIQDHIIYLKTRGDDSQKKQIADILAGITET